MSNKFSLILSLLFVVVITMIANNSSIPVLSEGQIFKGPQLWLGIAIIFFVINYLRNIKNKNQK